MDGVQTVPSQLLGIDRKADVDQAKRGNVESGRANLTRCESLAEVLQCVPAPTIVMMPRRSEHVAVGFL